MKVSRKQLRSIIVENIFSDAFEYVSDTFFGNYTPGDVVTTESEDPFEYKEQDGRWVYRKKDSDSTWKAVNRQGAARLNKVFKKDQDNSKESKKIAGQNNEVRSASDVYGVLVEKGIINEGDTLLLVDGVKHKFYLKRSSSGSDMSGLVSTGVKGFGNDKGSGKTSTGLMKVAGIAGRGLEKGTVLRGRKPTQPKIVLGPVTPGPRKGHTAEVLSRAIVLSGLENKNTNVRDRNIYIHGTNREHKLGSRASGGCVRVSNNNVIKLADSELKNGDYVYIFDGPASVVSTFRGSVSNLIDRGLEMVTEENSDAQEQAPKNFTKIDGKNASEDEAASILANYPAEENA